MFDTHIHLQNLSGKSSDLLDAFKLAGVDEGIVLSVAPETFFNAYESYSSYERLKHVMSFCESDQLYPFFWLDPLADDAIDQINNAVDAGISGFKIICDRFYPSDEEAMACYRAIALAGKPILFHSGILWDGKVSSKFNHPIEFECLLEVPKLRIALAHVSWPWCDDLIALYGKFLNAYSRDPEVSVELFIDTAPGTPPIYREEVLRKLYTVGYDIEHNMLWGSDTYAENYNVAWVKEWMQRDCDILSEIDVSDNFQRQFFDYNAKRFLGITDDVIDRKVPIQGA